MLNIEKHGMYIIQQLFIPPFLCLQVMMLNKNHKHILWEFLKVPSLKYPTVLSDALPFGISSSPRITKLNYFHHAYFIFFPLHGEYTWCEV